MLVIMLIIMIIIMIIITPILIALLLPYHHSVVWLSAGGSPQLLSSVIEIGEDLGYQ